MRLIVVSIMAGLPAWWIGTIFGDNWGLAKSDVNGVAFTIVFVILFIPLWIISKSEFRD